MSCHISKIEESIRPSVQRARRPSLLKSRLAGGALLFTLFVIHRWYIPSSIGFEIPRNSRERAPKVGTITWGGECESPEQECGSIIVPKDYFDSSAGTTSIAIARVKATRPKKGTIFLNPGGPGNSGTNGASASLAEFLGDEWDILGFDPRGIHHTSPQVRCFASTQEFDLFNANTVLEQGFTVPSVGNLSDPAVETALVEQSRQFIALKQAQAQICGHAMGDELRYMGSATVVRDMAFMADAFDGQGAKINFFGGSYGSILGAYLVNMLPDRAGFVFIDGIVDPINWSSEPGHKWTANWLASTEMTYRFFLETCVQAGPIRCPLAHHIDEPHTALETRLETFFDKLARAPMAVPFGRRPGYLTSGAARGLLLKYLEQPTEWADAARAFAAAFEGDGAPLLDALIARGHVWSPHHDLVRSAVACLDAPPPESPRDIPTAEDLAEELMRVLRGVSPHFGASLSLGEPDGGCEYWPARAPERFAGPWNASLEWPMLIVSNTMDPITPIQSGARIHSHMGNSTRLVIQDGPGHTSSSLPTPCTLKLIQAYYAGKLPENGTVCPTDFDYFPDPAAAIGLEKMFEGEESIWAGARAVQGLFGRR
ncbi:Alpha/Beta hydrolase protein [Mycena galericulata]|nr:Alpha/Beta hydrolase protein [Mycena galericulata]